MALPVGPYYPGMRPGLMGGAGGALDPFALMSMGMYGPDPMSMATRRLGMPYGGMRGPMGMGLRSGMMQPPLGLSMDYEEIYDYPRRRPRRGLMRRGSYGRPCNDWDDWDDIDPEELLTLVLRGLRGRGT